MDQRIGRTLRAAALAWALSTRAAWAGVDFNVASLNSFTRAWDGSGSGTALFACAAGDFNADGVDDLAFSEYLADTQGRTNNGAIYIVYGLHKSTGGVIDAVSSAYNVRVDGASTNDTVAECWAWDVNNDGLEDLVIRADGAAVLYALYAPLPSGSGNIFDLSNPAKYNAKLLVPGGAGLPYPFMDEINGDGIADLLIEVPNADTNGTDAGALYIRNGPFPAGTGNTIDLSVGSNFNLRIDGFAGSLLTSNHRTAPYWNYYAGQTTAVGDLNGDGAPDIAVGACWDDSWNRTDNGTVYVTTGPFPSTTGNVWRAANLERFMLKIGGFYTSGCLSRSVIADFTGDGKNDLCVNGSYDDPGGADSGGVYCLYGPLNQPGDTNLDLAVAANRNVVLAGAVFWNIGISGLRSADLDADGIADLLIESENVDTAFADAGALFVVNGGPGNFPPGTNSLRDLTNGAHYNTRISHDEPDSRVSRAPATIRDLDADGFLDLIVQGMGQDGDNCGGGYQGYQSVLYGPMPSTSNNNKNLGSLTDVDYRFHFSNCSMSSYRLAAGDFDGDGMQDMEISNRWFDNVSTDRGRVYFVSLSTAAPKIHAPGAFTNVTSQTFLWNAVSGASSYRLQVDTDPRFPAPLSDQTVGAASALVSGLSNGGSYYARVKATNGNFQRWGPILSFTVDTTPPTTPTLLTPGDASGTHPSVGTQTPLFDWTDASTE